MDLPSERPFSPGCIACSREGLLGSLVPRHHQPPRISGALRSGGPSESALALDIVWVGLTGCGRRNSTAAGAPLARSGVLADELWRRGSSGTHFADTEAGARALLCLAWRTGRPSGSCRGRRRNCRRKSVRCPQAVCRLMITDSVERTGAQGFSAVDSLVLGYLVEWIKGRA